MLPREQIQNVMLHCEKGIELPILELSKFLDSCRSIGIRLNDFESIIQRINRWIIIGFNEDLPMRELKKSLSFLRNLSDLFKNIRVQAIEEEVCSLSSDMNVQLIPADLSCFLESCQDSGIDINDFVLIIQNINDQLIDGIDEHLRICEVKDLLLFLLELEDLFASLALWLEVI